MSLTGESEWRTAGGNNGVVPPRGSGETDGGAGPADAPGKPGAGASGAAWADWITKSVWYASSTRPGGGSGRVPTGPDATLRASDSERNEIAEALSRHYSDGRLDKDELDERLRQAMAAKTRGELVLVLRDLPTITAATTLPATRGDRGRLARRAREMALVAVAVVVGVVLAILLWGDHTAAIVLAIIIGYFALRKAQRIRSQRIWHDHLHEHGTPHWHGSRGRVKLR